MKKDDKNGNDKLDKSIQMFFQTITEKIAKIDNKPCKDTTEVKNDYQQYSDAIQGLAQGNISKREGFSMNVEVSDEYLKQVEIVAAPQSEQMQKTQY